MCDSYFILGVKCADREGFLQEGKIWKLGLVILGTRNIKNDLPDHQEAISKWLDKYDSTVLNSRTGNNADIAKQLATRCRNP